MPVLQGIILAVTCPHSTFNIYSYNIMSILLYSDFTQLQLWQGWRKEVIKLLWQKEEVTMPARDTGKFAYWEAWDVVQGL